MLKTLYEKSYRLDSVPVDIGYPKVCPTESVTDGQIVRGSEFRYYNPSDEYGKLQSSDFSLANIIAVGAYDKLQPIIMTDNTNFSFVDKFSAMSVAQPKSE